MGGGGEKTQLVEMEEGQALTEGGMLLLETERKNAEQANIADSHSSFSKQRSLVLEAIVHPFSKYLLS